MAARIGTLECTELIAEVFLLLHLQDRIRKWIRFYTENAVMCKYFNMRETNGKRVFTGFINQEQPSNPSFLPRHVIISSGVAPLDF